MSWIKSLTLIFLASFTMLASSCSSDDDLNKEAPAEEYVTKAKDILSGDIVLSTKATMSGVDKTHLANGCPTKFNFTWKEDGTMSLSLVDFTVGSMPFAVTFKCSTKFMNLNSWDKDERPEAGWIKFQGKDGNVTTDGDDPKDCQSGSGATVDGYLNVLTNQIEFIVNYNMMNVRTETFQQTIDKNRINNFQQEFEQYEKDLIQWKKDNGEG
ncbi:DUF4903 domain-containing protein [Prevotella copri]|jgi:hypothetical protein|uniref:DUF4903 domain-containing protein n=2 Tax=Segatella copri TaxID=165179 RepID=A0AAW9T9S9_9BACT|nr:DUF4903 family protein [Segatella copri]MQN26239.1 DUF4903 domain-containing protein [Segatella copri]MQN30878.1 DUF4903 domain-containing protein [Segatella copri]MQN39020.1 DUF4903 domain-containing protein [Segatella copri]MQN73748.1 DUF4903 domain-containing protein [Segatella copri]MQO26595.1 DUF4903 domain-containing protein [Segatella copri]